MATPNQKQYALIQIIKKIRVFERLDIEEIVSLLKVCKTQTYPEKQRIYQAGDPSREMLILLKGHLQVTSDTGQILAEILPGRCVGEMGLFTGGKRSANIIASEPLDGVGARQKRVGDRREVSARHVYQNPGERHRRTQRTSGRSQP